MMKLLTCVVPCYNSAAYMERAVASLLAGGEEMEVLIVDDGSTDETGAIADRLAAEYPTVVRVHHQENAGHGSAINYGIAHAQGVYFKVVDSDDRLNTEHLPGLLDVLRQHTDEENCVDLVFHDYVYDREEQESTFRITYYGKLKPDTVSDWDHCRTFHVWNQFMIHSLIYRTRFLRDINLRLPEHTYYEDNLYIYRPLVHTKRILYHHAPMYGYFVGRVDQSITAEVSDQQRQRAAVYQLCAAVHRGFGTQPPDESGNVAGDPGVRPGAVQAPEAKPAGARRLPAGAGRRALPCVHLSFRTKNHAALIRRERGANADGSIPGSDTGFEGRI